MPGIRTNRRVGSRGGVAALVVAALSITWWSSATHAAPEEQALLVADGARNLLLVSRSATSRQISYRMDLDYPDRAIGEQQWQQLRSAGWTQCRSADPDQEAANQDWISFADISVKPERTVHQHLTHWSKDDQMIMISLRYYSATRNGNPKSRPDNSEQRVDLVFDDDHGREMATWLQLDCSN
jgi:hypothetical protein